MALAQTVHKRSIVDLPIFLTLEVLWYTLEQLSIGSKQRGHCQDSNDKNIFSKGKHNLLVSISSVKE